MEMAAQTKTETTTTTTVKATATGTGYTKYTQKVSSVKKQKLANVLLFNEKKANLSEMQYNNKTEIKISQNKQRNYLKFLINLYLKLFLCISQINKSILKILKTKLNTNYSFKAKKDFVFSQNPNNCIINLQKLQQQQQQQHQLFEKAAQSFKTILFKFKILITNLTKFNSTLEKYFEIFIKKILHNKLRHSVGIRPKRLISLKRLQQIPENHNKIDKTSICKQIRKISHNYGYLRKELRQHLEQEWQYNKENSENCQLEQDLQESSRALLSLRENKTGISASRNIVKNKNAFEKCHFVDKKYINIKMICQPLHNKETRTSSYLERPKTQQYIYRKCKSFSRKQAELKDFYFNKKCRPINLQEDAQYYTFVINSKVKQQNTSIKNLFVTIPKIDDKADFKAHSTILKLQDALHNSLEKCGQFNKIKFEIKAAKSPHFENIMPQNTNKIKLQELFLYSSQKLNQLNKPRVVLEPSNGIKDDNIKLLSRPKLQETLQKCGQLKNNALCELQKLFFYSQQSFFQVYGQAYKHRNVIIHVHKNPVEVDLGSKLQKFLIEINGLQLLTNIPQKCSQLNEHRVIIDLCNRKEDFRIEFRTKLSNILDISKKRSGQLENNRGVKFHNLFSNSFHKSGQSEYCNKNESQFKHDSRFHLEDKPFAIFLRTLQLKCSQLTKYRVLFELSYNCFNKTVNNKKESKANLQKKCCQLNENNKDLNLFQNLHEKCSQLERFYKKTKVQVRKLFSVSENCFSAALVNKKNKTANKTLDIQPKYSQKSYKKCSLLQQSSFIFIKGEADKKELATNKNSAKQFHSDNNNNSHEVAWKQKQFLKKCHHFLYSILVYFSCCCYWHIYGFPLVLGKILEYFKDATVHVLTRRLKITTKILRGKITTTIYCNYGNINAAICKGKFKTPTNVADYVVKRQTQQPATEISRIKKTTTTTNCISCEYSLSCCSTTSLTASSSHCTSPENLILLQQQPQQSWTAYCNYQQHYQHHHYQHNRPKLQQQTRQLFQHQQTQSLSLSQQQNTFNSTIQIQLPSYLVLSRTLIILMLLSSLWHTSEGFHGSGVKLSTNTVKTKYGLVRGIVVRSSPSLVEAYLGIPYASPPVGSLRFMPPITPSTWKTVRNADRFSPVCPQNVPIPPNGPEALLEVPRARLAQLRRLLPLLSNQSEDCLYLNIYVPYENRRHRRFTTSSGEMNDTPKFPTILFIHGESYEWNSGNPYDGSELAAHGNVIVVTINFRLGILGFLKTGGKESAQGNFGLMDLVAGLHWLKENLPAFGGDPQQITLLGHGTGAALANILAVSPVASDLVQHVVMVSGSALSPWAIQKNPLFVKRRVAEQTGCHGDMLYYDLAPCLRTKSVAELLAVKIDHPRFLVGFAPFIDGTVISPNTDYIGKLSLPLGSAIVSTSGIEYANFPKRNLIFCLTSVESHLDLSAQDLEFGFNETRRDRILRTYVRNNFHYHLNEIFAVLKNEYTDWDKAIRSPLSSRDATLQFLSDGHTASSLIKLGYMHSLRGGRGYFLHFKHRTVEEEYPQRTGSVRGEDVPFWLGLPISPLFPHNYTTQEKQISRLMLRYLANFAKTGNPNQSSPSSPLPSPSSLIDSLSLSSSSTSSSSSSSNQAADDPHNQVKRSSFNIVNATSSIASGPINNNAIVVDVATAAAREALNLAVLYNQRRTKRTFYKRHSRSNDDHSGSASSEVNYFVSNNNNNNNNKLDGDEMPFWDAYDVVNQLYMELGNKAEIQSHYRGHKLSMWLNLIPQLHRHANMNDQSMRHHQFQDDLNNLNLYEGIVRAQIQTKPDDDDETLLLPKGRPTPPPQQQETNSTQKPNGGTTECGVDGAMFVAEMTTIPPSDNRSLVLDSREKEMATASTGLIGNLEVLRRLGGKQFQSYTTALVATVAVGCFLLILNILIFAGIYHQREKRARDAKTKEELQDNDTSKNSSMLKLNAMGSETGSFNDSGAGVSGKATVVFGEYSCYDEKSLQTKNEKLIVELPPPQVVDPNWAACSTSTLDLLKTKHHIPPDTSYTLSNVVPINTESQTDHLMAVNNLEMATYNPLPMTSGLIIDSAAISSSGLLSKRGSFLGSSGQLNQYDFASVQSSDQMSFKDIENAVKASATMDDDIMQDDDIPEPPPPPRSFHSMQQQQQQQQQGGPNAPVASSGSGGGGILRQAGTTSSTQTGGGKKRVHIQEISV